VHYEYFSPNYDGQFMPRSISTVVVIGKEFPKKRRTMKLSLDKTGHYSACVKNALISAIPL
jgi:hypothetical protein